MLVVTTLADAMASRTVILDGGLSTLLEDNGHDLSTELWSARLLRDDPGQIYAAHCEYFAAGAEVATTASYQASFEGFAAVGIGQAETERLLTESVRLARQARDELAPNGWVAASIGPFGAVLADGSEYTGDYALTIAELGSWHRPRLEVLVEAGPDVLAIETIPCLAEVEALLTELEGTGVPAWLSLTAADGWARRGEHLAEAFAMAADVSEIVAVGVNCCSPADVVDVMWDATTRTGLPGVAYPNSGEGWDADGRRWTGAPRLDPALVRSWVDAGARLVGGCCRVRPEQIRRMVDLIG